MASCSLVPRLSERAETRGVAARARDSGPAGPPVRAARLSTFWPSMSSTILSSEPGVTSTTPMVSPSRSTVARSQTSAISISRCEMKMTERSPPRRARSASRTRSVRFAGRAAVISSSISTSGSIARARARSMIRSEASGSRRAGLDRSRSARPSSPSQWRNGSRGVSVRRRLARTSRSGMRDGSWYTDASPPRRASAGEWMARSWPRTTIRPASGWTAPVRILTSVLLPAPLAPTRAWTSPGRTASEADLSATTAP